LNFYWQVYYEKSQSLQEKKSLNNITAWTETKLVMI